MTNDMDLMSAVDAQKEEKFLQDSATPPATQPKTNKVKLSFVDFHSLIRQNPWLFYKKYKKMCSCDPQDLRWEETGVECGKCSAKLVVNQ